MCYNKTEKYGLGRRRAIKMKKEYIMGNSAIALGALAAGLNLAAGYPGTPSSEIMETLERYPHG